MEIVNEINFDEIIKNGTVLVDFYADWCGPCKMLAPVLEELAQEKTDVTFIKVNVDQSPSLAARYGVQSIPNLVVLQDGSAIDQIIGFVPKQQIIDALAKAK